MGGLGGIKGKSNDKCIKRVAAVRKSRAEATAKSQKNVDDRLKKTTTFEEQRLKAEKEAKKKAKAARAKEFAGMYGGHADPYGYGDDEAEEAEEAEAEAPESGSARTVVILGVNHEGLAIYA